MRIGTRSAAPREHRQIDVDGADRDSKLVDGATTEQ